MAADEVVITVDGRPRPAVVVATDGDRTQVRYRDAGSWVEEWLPTSEVLAVEEGRATPPWLKLAGLGVLGVLGLVLVLYPGGNERLADKVTPTATPTAKPTATPTPSLSASPEPSPTAAATKPVTAVLFGDSLASGRGVPPGTPTLLQVAAQKLGWKSTVRAGDGTAYTTGGKRGGLPYAARLAREVTSAPDVLVLQGGASDTGASPEQLTQAATAVVREVKRRFPTTKLVLLGPVAMEQPPDGQLVRVAATLKAVAQREKVPFVDPIGLHWITAANHGDYTSATGFYPNAAGHAYLGGKLAAVLAALV